MKKQAAIFFISLTMLFNQAAGQSFKKQFNEIFAKKDTSEQRQLLEKWAKADSNDPELYVAYFNYYVNKSMKDIITLGQKPKGEDALRIMDKDTAKKTPAAYMYGDTYYDLNLLEKGFNYIDKGIEKNPSRLDMRFGKIYMFGKIEDYENFTTEIIKAVDYSVVIKNKWTWSDNNPVEGPEEFLLSSVQTYQLQLYNTENDTLLDNMKRIAEAVLKHYPNHIESLSNLSIVYLLRNEFDKALEPLLKAEKLDPTDYIVSNNIAQAYKLKGDIKNAIKYYELTIKNGDQQAKEYARKQIDELKKE